jgi:hypothetical protein
MILSALDAILTIAQINKGLVREANPVMNIVIAYGGIYAFFSLKAAMTAFALAMIFLHKEWVLARTTAWLCLGCYVFVLCYHAYLFSSHYGLMALLAPF